MAKEKLTLNTRVMLTPSFTNKHITVRESKLDLKLDFQEGEHTFSSKPIEVGKTDTGKLYASLSFWYNLNMETRTFSLSSNDLISERAPFIELKHEKEAHVSRQYAHTVRHLQSKESQLWSHEAGLYGALPELLNGTLGKLNDQIIEKCKTLGFNLVLGTKMPSLGAEEIDKYSAVYNKEGFFVELYNPRKKYGDGFSIHNLSSTWYGEVTFALNENFANVIGSSSDPRIGGLSWIQLWRNQFGVPDNCSSLNYGGFNCKGGPIGGHVIAGKKATVVPAGVNYVYIMPICTSHNNNDNVYMAAIKYVKGIALVNYLKSS